MKRALPAAGRINVKVSQQAWDHLRDLAEIWFPGRKRVDGIVVEQVIEEVYRRVMEQPRWNNEAFSPRALELNQKGEQPE